MVRRLVTCAAIVMLSIMAGGCSTCSDGTTNRGVFGSSYKACNMGCVDKEKECRCSNQCPCWKKHS